MYWSKTYFVTYNKLLMKNIDELIDIALYSSNSLLENIALRILIDYDYLLNNSIGYDVLNSLVDKMNVEDLWQLMIYKDEYIVSIIARNKILSIIDQTFNNKKVFSLIKK